MSICEIHNFSLRTLGGLHQDDHQSFAIYSLEQLKGFAQIDQPHRHDFYTIILPLKAKGVHEVDFTTHTLTPGQVYFISPGQVHVWHSLDEIKGYLIVFETDFFELRYHNHILSEFPFFNPLQNEPVVFLSAENRIIIEGLAHTLYKQYCRYQSPYASVIIRSYLNIMLCELARMYTPVAHGTDRHKSIVRHFEQLIAKHFLTKKKVKDYADVMALTPNYLNEVCHQVTGQTAGMLIRRKIITEAKRLLAHTDFSINEVAYAIHFEDASYFCRFFKRHVLFTPENFRENVRLSLK